MGSAIRDTQTFPGDSNLRPPSRLMSSRPPRNLLSQVHWFRGQAQQDFNTSTSTTTSLTFAPALSNFPFSGEIAALFDQYSLYEFGFSVSNISPIAGSGELPSIHSVIDFDGQSFLTPPTSVATLDQYGTVMTSILAPGKSMSRVFKPCVETIVFQTTFLDGFATERVWLDSGNTSVPHYGILALANLTPGGISQLRVTYTVIVAARNNN